jgi:translation initiation factor 2B subunit (eIF-2B alpha/beta/delta family)
MLACQIPSKGAKRSQSFIDSLQLLEQVLETVNEFTKDRREHIENMDDEIKQVKDKIINAKQGWISYLESLEKTLLENVQGQKDKFVSNAQEEIFETKQIDEDNVLRAGGNQ